MQNVQNNMSLINVEIGETGAKNNIVTETIKYADVSTGQVLANIYTECLK